MATVAAVDNRVDSAREGGSFHDDPAVLERYRAHRLGGVDSPNDVMDEPAVQRALGSVAGLRVLDLGCGDAALGGPS